MQKTIMKVSIIIMAVAIVSEIVLMVVADTNRLLSVIIKIIIFAVIFYSYKKQKNE